jgi:hypothetical protein
VPFFFDGDASRPFQVASHLHYTLRMALLVNEFRIRVGGTSRLSPRPVSDLGYGYDFEAGR